MSTSQSFNMATEFESGNLRDAEIDTAIIDFLSECKFARAVDIAQAVGVNIHTCKQHLDELRKRGVDVGSISGQGYYYKPLRDDDTNQATRISVRIRSELEYLSSVGICSLADVANKFGVCKQTVSEDIRQLCESGYPIVIENNTGLVAFGQDCNFNEYRERCWIGKILSAMQTGTLYSSSEIASKLNKSDVQTLKYLHLAKERSLVSETTDHYYALPSDCPYGVLHSNMVVIWEALYERRRMGTHDISELTGCSLHSVRETMRRMMSRCPYIVKIREGQFVYYCFDESKF